MAEVMTMGSAISSSQGVKTAVSARQLPLSFLKSGDEAQILKVRGAKDLQRHLGTLGFVPGANIKVISDVSGDLIVEIKATNVALSRQVALSVITAVA